MRLYIIWVCRLRSEALVSSGVRAFGGSYKARLLVFLNNFLICTIDFGNAEKMRLYATNREFDYPVYDPQIGSRIAIFLSRNTCGASA